MLRFQNIEGILKYVKTSGVGKNLPFFIFFPQRENDFPRAKMKVL